MSKTKRNRVKGDQKIDIRKALKAPLHLKQDGVSRTMSAYEATIRQHLNKAIVGRSMPSLKFILREAEKHDVIEKADEPLKGGVFIVPKWLPDHLQHEIFDYRPEQDTREPMSRIWNIIRGFINDCKQRAKANAKSKAE